MNVLLAAVNAKYIHSNLAVYSLRQYAKEAGYQVRMAEYTINQQQEEIVRSIFEQKPDVLCFSCYIWNISLIGSLISDLHKILPQMKIWLGGPEVSYDAPEVLCRWPEICGVMKGEGEETFTELLRYYSEGTKRLEEIDGIVFRGSDGNIVQTKMRRPLELSKIPFPYEDLEDFAHRIIYYESSRGCPFSCSYCLSSVDKKLRFRQMEIVKKELDFFLERKVPQVKFVDRTFNCKSKHARAIWRYLTEKDNQVTNFHFEIAADLLEEEDFALFSKMRPGLIQLEIGVQTTNEQTLKEIRRHMDFSKVAWAVRRIESCHNIHQHLDLIAGLPYENYESFCRSFDQVYGLHPEQLQLGFLKVLKGSWMWENQKNYGLLYRAHEPYEVLATDWVSYEELAELKRVEEMVEVYYNSGQFRYTIRMLEGEFSSFYQMYRSLADFYREHGLENRSHSRMQRFERLLEFIEERGFEKQTFYQQLLTLDYYLRENGKSRPTFAPQLMPAKVRRTYEKLYDTVLQHYEGYEHRQIQRMTHLEFFDYDVLGTGEKEACAVLFDYQRRDPLTRDAQCHKIKGE